MLTAIIIQDNLEPNDADLTPRDSSQICHNVPGHGKTCINNQNVIFSTCVRLGKFR